MLSVQNRTQEFKSAVAAQARLRQNAVPAPQTRSAKSQFAQDASKIAAEIADTTQMLQRLAQLAQRKTLFDDRPVEINELTHVIKQKVSRVNEQLTQLQQRARTNTSQKQTLEHSKNVVVLLQEKLSTVTAGFADVLEERTRNIQASKSRHEQFISATSASTQQAASSPLYGSGTASSNPFDTQLQQEQMTADPETSDLLTLPQQDTLLLDQQDMYVQQRSSAVEAIESTIQELGGMFSQLATMVAEQRETVARIDQNTDDISLNVSGAQRELMKYYARISSNRWLMVKVFGIVIAFFMLWVLIS
ncbi:Integral membrane protein [Yarrowia sp. B02]|nr:Integral membrane protein [Yarrowia sp. B02]